MLLIHLRKLYVLNMSCSSKPTKQGKRESSHQVQDTQGQCHDYVISKLKPSSDSADNTAHVWGWGISVIPTQSQRPTEKGRVGRAGETVLYGRRQPTLPPPSPIERVRGQVEQFFIVK